jgi:hypothetical protein
MAEARRRKALLKVTKNAKNVPHTQLLLIVSLCEPNDRQTIACLETFCLSVLRTDWENYGVFRDSFQLPFSGRSHSPLGRMRFVLYSPAQARLKAKGEYSIKRSPEGMIALQAKAEKFLGRLFSKRRAGSLRTVGVKTQVTVGRRGILRRRGGW